MSGQANIIRAAQRAMSPKDLLYPLQRRFVDDKSQFKLGVTTRQWGKSMTTSGEAVHDALTDPGTKWVCMSAGERQSVEWLSKCKEWLQAYQMIIADQLDDRGGIAEGLLRSSEIVLANGSRIIAIPANPGTARGYSANIILDEFAYHEDPEAIWAAMFPSTTNRLAGTFLDRWRAMLKGEDTDIRRDLKLRVVSTFNGRNNKFFELYEKAEENGYSVHKVTIHDAVADGMPLDIEKLKRALDDADAWAQEYECEPMDTSTVLLTYELIASCESPEATRMVADDWWEAPHANPLYLGLDFARKKHLSVLWTNEELGDVAHTREVMEMKNMSTPDQFKLVAPRVAKARRISVDYTGPGVGIGDLLVEAFREWKPTEHKWGKVELFNFSGTSKNELLSRLRTNFERQRLRVPVDRVIREDLHSMCRQVSASGNITYRAPQTEDGHADRLTALALAELARATGMGKSAAYTKISRPKWRVNSRGRGGLLSA
jgi:phage FluMu gp28-like protein